MSEEEAPEPDAPAGTDDEEFQVDDLGYIIEKAADHKKIVQWAQSMLEKRSAADEKNQKPKQRRRRKRSR